jgi:hypothetical protein
MDGLVFPNEMLVEIAMASWWAFKILICANKALNNNLGKVNIKTTFCRLVVKENVLSCGYTGWILPDDKFYIQYIHDTGKMTMMRKNKVVKVIKLTHVLIDTATCSSYIKPHIITRYRITANGIYSETIEIDNFRIIKIVREYDIGDLIVANVYSVTAKQMTCTMTILNRRILEDECNNIPWSHKDTGIIHDWNINLPGFFVYNIDIL